MLVGITLEKPGSGRPCVQAGAQTAGARRRGQQAPALASPPFIPRRGLISRRGEGLAVNFSRRKWRMAATSPRIRLDERRCGSLRGGQDPHSIAGRPLRIFLVRGDQGVLERSRGNRSPLPAGGASAALGPVSPFWPPMTSPRIRVRWRIRSESSSGPTKFGRTSTFGSIS